MVAASLGGRLAKGSILTAGAVGAYLVTAHFSREWVLAHHQRNYLAMWLVALAVIHLLIAFRRHIRSAVNSMATQLEQMTSSGKITSVSVKGTGHVSDVIDKLNQLLTLTRTQLDQLGMEVRELRVQSRIASAEKQDIEAIIFSISEAVIVTNRYDELVLANGPAENLLGFRFRSNVRRSIDQCISDSTLVRLIRDARRNGVGSSRRVFEHTMGVDGKDRTFSVTLSCVITPQDQINGVVAVLRDMTHEKEISQMKSDFVSNVSHELKTPLASIMAYMEMLVDGEAADEQARQSFYKIIMAETDRLNRLIENILNVSRIESGAIHVVPRLFSMTTLTRQVLAVADPQAKAKELELTHQLAPEYHHVFVDDDLIYQAALNLVSNAIKYTSRGGKVHIEVNADETSGKMIFSVSDTGAGIGPEDLGHVFEKFYRVRANNKLAEGTGLGLALVKYIIETLCKGKITVTSELGRGSTFSFELPLAHDEH